MAVLSLLLIALVGAILFSSRHPTNSQCVAPAASWTTKVASGNARLSDARSSLDPRTYNIVASSLTTQIEADALRPGNRDEPAPDTLRRIRLMCETPARETRNP